MGEARRPGPTVVKLTLRPDNTIVFKGAVVPRQDYETIPRTFRDALETAFPQLIVRSTAVMEFEPEESVEVLPPGDLIPHELAGVTVYQRLSDGYFNATAMCKAAGREFKHYNSNDTARAFLTELAGSVGIPTDRIVLTIKDGPNALRGTWVHPDVAIHLAQWCSAKFAVQVSQWVREWFTTGQAPISAIDFSDPVAACKLYLEAEEGRRQGLTLIKTATVEKVQAIALRDEAPMRIGFAHIPDFVMEQD